MMKLFAINPKEPFMRLLANVETFDLATNACIEHKLAFTMGVFPFAYCDTRGWYTFDTFRWVACEPDTLRDIGEMFGDERKYERAIEHIRDLEEKLNTIQSQIEQNSRRFERKFNEWMQSIDVDDLFNEAVEDIETDYEEFNDES